MVTRKAATYVRISQDREGAGLGVDRQRADCEALAGKLGWTIVAVHTDNDISAYSGRQRPGYRALLDDLEAGRASGVLVWHTDRLHRSPRELEEYVDVCERHKVVTQTCQAGELDLATPSGRAVARTLGAWARFESEHKSERIRRAQLQAAQAGKWLGGGRPFGWQVRDGGFAVLDRAEAREVRKAVRAVLSGASLGSVVADLNRRAVRTATGRGWSYATVRQMLTRARNAGLSTFHGEVIAVSTWPAIVTEDEYRSVVALLSDPGRRRSTSNRVRWMLAGIAQCGVCGAVCRSGTVRSNAATGSKRTVYRCSTPGKGHVARSAGPVDDLVSGVVVARLSQPDVAALLVDTDNGVDLDSLRVEAVALRGRLGEVADLYADGKVTAAQLAKATERVRGRLAEVDQTMTQANRSASLAPFLSGRDAGAEWERLDLDRRRSIIRELMTVTILPTGRRGNAFDPESVRIEWRDG